MLVARVDHRDRPIDVIPRSEVFEQAANFRVVHILIEDPKRGFLIQKLPASHPRHPGYWGSSVAGYVAAGESYLQAARRKLVEEVGIVLPDLKHLGKFAMQDEGCTKFVSVFLAELREPIELNPAHFADHRFVAAAELVGGSGHASRTGPLTPTFSEVLRFVARPARK